MLSRRILQVTFRSAVRGYDFGSRACFACDGAEEVSAFGEFARTMSCQELKLRKGLGVA